MNQRMIKRQSYRKLKRAREDDWFRAWFWNAVGIPEERVPAVQAHFQAHGAIMRAKYKTSTSQLPYWRWRLNAERKLRVDAAMKEEDT